METRQTIYHAALENFEAWVVWCASLQTVSLTVAGSLWAREQDIAVLCSGDSHYTINQNSVWTEPQVLTEPQVEIVIQTINKAHGLHSWFWWRFSGLWAFHSFGLSSFYCAWGEPCCFVPGLQPYLDRNYPPPLKQINKKTNKTTTTKPRKLALEPMGQRINHKEN